MDGKIMIKPELKDECYEYEIPEKVVKWQNDKVCYVSERSPTRA